MIIVPTQDLSQVFLKCIIFILIFPYKKVFSIVGDISIIVFNIRDETFFRLLSLILVLSIVFCFLSNLLKRDVEVFKMLKSSILNFLGLTSSNLRSLIKVFKI